MSAGRKKIVPPPQLDPQFQFWRNNAYRLDSYLDKIVAGREVALSDLTALFFRLNTYNQIAELAQGLKLVLSSFSEIDVKFRGSFLKRVLTAIFNVIHPANLAAALKQAGPAFLVDLLELTDRPSLQYYLQMVQNLHKNKFLASSDYASLVWTPEIVAQLMKVAASDPKLIGIYLSLLSRDLVGGIIPFRLIDYLNLRCVAQLPIFEMAEQLIKDKLQLLQLRFRHGRLSREDYLAEMTGHAGNGLTPLHLIIAAKNPALLQVYLNFLAGAADDDEIEKQVLCLSQDRQSCLHGLAYSGDTSVLYCFVQFLMSKFAFEKANAILKKLASTPNVYDFLPQYNYSELTHPMNRFLANLHGREGNLRSACASFNGFELREQFDLETLFMASPAVLFSPSSASKRSPVWEVGVSIQKEELGWEPPAPR